MEEKIKFEDLKTYLGEQNYQKLEIYTGTRTYENPNDFNMRDYNEYNKNTAIYKDENRQIHIVYNSATGYIESLSINGIKLPVEKSILQEIGETISKPQVVLTAAEPEKKAFGTSGFNIQKGFKVEPEVNPFQEQKLGFGPSKGFKTQPDSKPFQVEESKFGPSKGFPLNDEVETYEEETRSFRR